MTHDSDNKLIKHFTPVTFHIQVEGHLAESWSERLAGMRITTRARADQTMISTLMGRLRDPAELSSALISLYGLHVSIFIFVIFEPFVAISKLNNHEPLNLIDKGEKP